MARHAQLRTPRQRVRHLLPVFCVPKRGPAELAGITLSRCCCSLRSRRGRGSHTSSEGPEAEHLHHSGKTR